MRAYTARESERDMSRSYAVMREVLSAAAKARRSLDFDDFMSIHQRNKVIHELKRLNKDGLLDAVIDFDAGGTCLVCAVNGLTEEGAEFFKLIENDEVWNVIRETLKMADIDISYPLLKEVCEEIVKRYVVSFIPEIPSRALQ